MSEKVNLSALTDDQLKELGGNVAAEAERRRDKIEMEDIKIGMDDETSKRAWAEVRRALGEGR